MDRLSAYTGVEMTEEVRDHVKFMLMVVIPDMKYSEDYGEEFYKKADEFLHENPCSTIIEGKVFNNLSDMVKAVADDYTESIKSGKPYPGLEDIGSMSDEEITAYMATHFGL